MDNEERRKILHYHMLDILQDSTKIPLNSVYNAVTNHSNAESSIPWDNTRRKVTMGKNNIYPLNGREKGSE